MFNLPGIGFRQRITSTSSVPMTLNDVIVHVRQFVIALVSVDGCSSFPDPDGFLDVLDSSVGILVYNFHSLPIYDVVFICRMVSKGGFIDGRYQSFFPLLVYLSFFVLSTSFLCSSSRVFSSLPVSPMYSAPQFLHGIWYTSSPCSSSSTLSLGLLSYWATASSYRVITLSYRIIALSYRIITPSHRVIATSY